MSKERGRRGRQAGYEGGSCKAVRPRGGLGLLPGRMWASWRIVGSGGAGPDAGAYRRPLVAAAGKTDHEGVALIQVGEDGTGPRWMQRKEEKL